MPGFYVITYENGVVKYGEFDSYSDALAFAEDYYRRGFRFTIEEYASEKDYFGK